MGADPENAETPVQRRRALDRADWDAFWTVKRLDSDGTYFSKFKYLANRFLDMPATWFREKIVEPLHDRNKMPYYHRKLSRVPEIDECGVNDMACFYEANEQYRLDKLVDGFILQILRQRAERCTLYHAPQMWQCAKQYEDVEENELNFFTKYGELGSEADVADAYMKQKHRLIWERRHPEIMEARVQAVKEHKEKLAKGDFDFAFWKKGLWFQDKKNLEPLYEYYPSKSPVEADKPLSKDWEYYKQVAEDPEFDKKQGKDATFNPLFPF